VPVPVHAGFEQLPRPIDLDVTAYLERMERRDSLAFDLEDTFTVVDRARSGSDFTTSWAIFSSYDVRIALFSFQFIC
jgi:hypothetical protein